MKVLVWIGRCPVAKTDETQEKQGRDDVEYEICLTTGLYLVPFICHKVCSPNRHRTGWWLQCLDNIHTTKTKMKSMFYFFNCMLKNVPSTKENAHEQGVDLAWLSMSRQRISLISEARTIKKFSVNHAEKIITNPPCPEQNLTFIYKMVQTYAIWTICTFTKWKRFHSFWEQT